MTRWKVKYHNILLILQITATMEKFESVFTDLDTHTEVIINVIFTNTNMYTYIHPPCLTYHFTCTYSLHIHVLFLICTHTHTHTRK